MPRLKRETVAITLACERFRDYLNVECFLIEIDHTPLVPLLGAKQLDQLPALEDIMFFQ